MAASSCVMLTISRAGHDSERIKVEPFPSADLPPPDSVPEGKMPIRRSVFGRKAGKPVDKHKGPGRLVSPQADRATKEV